MPEGRAPSGVSSERLPGGIEISQRSLLALSPWTVVGASVYALFQTGVLSPPGGELVVVSAAYLGTALLAALVWVAAALVADRTGVPTETPLAVAGILAAAVAVGVVLSTAEGDLRLAWPLAGVAGTFVGTAVVWAVLRAVRPDVTERVGGLGALALFGQLLDGLLTAIGIDVFGFGERTPLSRIIIEFAADLPTADLLGSGWLLLVVKAGLAVGVLWFLADAVEDDPTTGLLLLAAVAAVGLGPGLHNALLFIVATPG
ncbi:DUF63 domain-containing protein [Halobacteriales archaeon QS_8_69_26]|nr:MAG: DUF63 domain-containing protein [Halobacteriales archaeon QS_8_69_26]